MAGLNQVREKYGANICRKCINREYQVNLKPSDCEYANPFPSLCACCGEPKNIVTGLRLTGKLKLLGK